MIDLEHFREKGYLTGLGAFRPEERSHLFAVYRRLRALLPPGVPADRMDWWHARDRELWEICRAPRILDWVAEILGPDFYLWGSQFFCKDPGDARTVPWHQDAFYWPLSPPRSLTVWVAVSDADEENGAMQVLPGTHRHRLPHAATGREGDVLDSGIDPGAIDPSGAVSLVLEAGQASIHDDRIAHGSGRNRSGRPRLGLTIRFSAGEVRCDTSVWPFFKAFWCRGRDRWGHNPAGAPPTSNMSEFENVTPGTAER